MQPRNLSEYLQKPEIQEKLQKNVVKWIEGNSTPNPNRILNDFGSKVEELPTTLQVLIKSFEKAIEADIAHDLSQEQPRILTKLEKAEDDPRSLDETIRSIYKNTTIWLNYLLSYAVEELFESDATLKKELAEAIQGHIAILAPGKTAEELNAFIKSQMVNAYILVVTGETDKIVKRAQEKLAQTIVQRFPNHTESTFFGLIYATSRLTNNACEVPPIYPTYIHDVDKKLEEASLEESVLKDEINSLSKSLYDELIERVQKKIANYNSGELKALRQQEFYKVANTQLITSENIIALRKLEMTIDFDLAQEAIKKLITDNALDQHFQKQITQIASDAEKDLRDNHRSIENITATLKLAIKAYETRNLSLMAIAELTSILKSDEYARGLKLKGNVILEQINNLLLRNLNEKETTSVINILEELINTIKTINAQYKPLDVQLIALRNQFKENKTEEIKTNIITLETQLNDLEKSLSQLDAATAKIYLEMAIASPPKQDAMKVDLETQQQSPMTAEDDQEHKTLAAKYLANSSHLENYYKNDGQDPQKKLAHNYMLISKFLEAPHVITEARKSAFYFLINDTALDITSLKQDSAIKAKAQEMITKLLHAETLLEMIFILDATKALSDCIKSGADHVTDEVKFYDSLLDLYRLIGEAPLEIKQTAVTNEITNQILALTKPPFTQPGQSPLTLTDKIIKSATKAVRDKDVKAIKEVSMEIANQKLDSAIDNLENAIKKIPSSHAFHRIKESAVSSRTQIRILRNNNAITSKKLTELANEALSVTKTLNEKPTSFSALLTHEFKLLALKYQGTDELVKPLREPFIHHSLDIDEDAKVEVLENLISFVTYPHDENLKFHLALSVAKALAGSKNKEGYATPELRESVRTLNKQLIHEIEQSVKQGVPASIFTDLLIAMNDRFTLPENKGVEQKLEKSLIELPNKPGFINYFSNRQNSLINLYSDYNAINNQIAYEAQINANDPALDIIAKQRREQKILNLIADLRKQDETLADDLQAKFDIINTKPTWKDMWRYTFTRDKNRNLLAEALIVPKFDGPLALNIFKGVMYGLLFLTGLPLLRLIPKTLEFGLLVFQKFTDKQIERAHRLSNDAPVAAKIFAGVAIGIGGAFSYAAKGLRVWLRAITSPIRSASEGRRTGVDAGWPKLGLVLAGLSVFTSLATYVALAAVAAVYAIPALIGSGITYVSTAASAVQFGLTYAGAKIAAWTAAAAAFVGVEIGIPAALTLGALAIKTEFAIGVLAASLIIPAGVALRAIGGKIGEGITHGWNKLKASFGKKGKAVEAPVVEDVQQDNNPQVKPVINLSPVPGVEENKDNQKPLQVMAMPESDKQEDKRISYPHPSQLKPEFKKEIDKKLRKQLDNGGTKAVVDKGLRQNSGNSIPVPPVVVQPKGENKKEVDPQPPGVSPQASKKGVFAHDQGKAAMEKATTILPLPFNQLLDFEQLVLNVERQVLGRYRLTITYKGQLTEEKLKLLEAKLVPNYTGNVRHVSDACKIDFVVGDVQTLNNLVDSMGANLKSPAPQKI